MSLFWGQQNLEGSTLDVGHTSMTLITQFYLLNLGKLGSRCAWIWEKKGNHEKNLLITSIYGMFLLRSALKTPTAFRKQQSEEHSWIGDAVSQKNIRLFSDYTLVYWGTSALRKVAQRLAEIRKGNSAIVLVLNFSSWTHTSLPDKATSSVFNSQGGSSRKFGLLPPLKMVLTWITAVAFLARNFIKQRWRDSS